MPYILSPIIKKTLPPLWQEGVPYTTQNLYSIQNDKLPPVHYDSHIIKPHSLTHIETPKHTQKDGMSIDQYFNKKNFFYGKVLVIKLPGNKYVQSEKEKNIFHWVIQKDELEAEIGLRKFNKIFITTENYPENEFGFHNPNYVLTLSQNAADYLVSIESFNLYGTTWKSSDFNPGSPHRPIHDTLFKKALIVECLSLNHVPSGEYFLVCFPLPLEMASESPVLPVLFTEDEIKNIF